jgi:hypothetical protein
VANADFAIVGNRAGNAECLQAGAQRFGNLRGNGLILLDGGGRANQIGPAGVLK